MLDLDQGVEAGLGTAARSTSSTSRRNSLRSGHFRADNILIVTPLFLSMGLVYTLSGSELVRKQM